MLTALTAALTFPDPDQALRDPNGLLAVGGDLQPERLLLAYRQGIFPWYSRGEPILWWSPDPRAVIPTGGLHVSRSLHRDLRRQPFAVSCNRAFTEVVEHCAAVRRRGQHGTWIHPAMQRAYCRLHQLGHAHSVEVWLENRLVGGVYGVRIGSVFCGESMFSLVSNASKLALMTLFECPHLGPPSLLDCQVMNPHLASLGAVAWPRWRFLEHLRLQGEADAAPTGGQ